MTANPEDAESQYITANNYKCQRSYSEAARWYRKAAEQGHANAQYELGWCYFLGQGVKENREEAKKWWKKAADQGHLSAWEYWLELQL